MTTRTICFATGWLVLSLLSGGTAAAQAPATIDAVVQDAQTHEALPGAHVLIVGTSMGGSTDVSGRCVIRNVPPGSYMLRATYIGYATLTVPIAVATGASLHESFALVPASVSGDTVLVTAQAVGQNAAINEQLAANGIVSVVSSARIQELPDANAAEAVGRLPGVSILRSGGEGTEVVVRGLQPKFNLVTIDGVRMASSNPNDRSTDLSMISPFSLEGIEVSKTVTPDQDADVLGGTVDFKMRDARNDKPGLGLSLLAQGGYTGLRDAPNRYNNYKYVGSVEGRFLDDRFGVFAQADLERRNLTSNEYGATFDHLGSSTTLYTTTGLNLNDIPRDKRRSNGTLVMDYALPNGRIGLTNFVSSGVTEAANRGEFFDIVNNLHNYSLAYTRSTLNLITNVLHVEDQLPLVHASMRLSHTYSETKDPGDWTATFQQTSAGLSQFNNVANLIPGNIPKAAANDLSKTDLAYFVNNNSFSRERALAASLDLDAPVTISDAVSAVLKVGGKYRHQTRSTDNEQFDGQGLSLQSAGLIDSYLASHFPSTLPYQNTTSIPITAFIDPAYSYGRFLNGNYTLTAPLSSGMMSEISDLLKTYHAQNGDNIAYGHDNFASTSNDYTGYEKMSAGYVMATLNVGPDLTIIPGVRYQDLRTTYTASRGVQGALSYYIYNHYDTTVAVDHGYWLPDVILRYKPLPWFDVRLSYTNTISYPDYQAIIPRIDVGSYGALAWNNAHLVPSRSTNYDAYASFYSNTIGLFTVGGFLKRIDNLIYSWNFYVSNADALPYFPPGLLGVTGPPSGTYDISTFVNDPYTVNDWGVELDWQTHFWYLPHPLDGLTLNVNYTHVFSKAQYPYTEVKTVNRVLQYTDTSFTDRLLFQPNDILNVALGYDYGGFSVHISVLYQADIFTGPNYWDQLRTSTSAYTRWDLACKQELPWFGLQLFGDLNNINGVNDISVIHASTGVPQSEQSYGLSADVGIRYRF